MFWFKNFRIRRRLCTIGCGRASFIRVVNVSNGYKTNNHYCPEHAPVALYWAKQTGSKTYRDTGAR